MSALRMCDLGHVNRAGLHRFDPKAETPDDDLDLRDDIQKIAREFPCYGRPRITAELKRRASRKWQTSSATPRRSSASTMESGLWVSPEADR